MKMRKISALIVALAMCIAVFPIQTFAVDYNGVEFTALDGTGNNSEGENYEKLLDGSTTAKWCDKIGLVDGINYTPYIIFKASKQIIITDYNFVACNDTIRYPERNPKDWVLYGCNDYDEANKTDGTWVAIHTVTDNTVMQNVNYYPYNFKIEDNNEMYQYYKLEITANQGSAENLMQLSELQINWTVPYNVTFDENGGDTEAIPKIIGAGQGLPMTNPTKAGHKFVGWYTKDGVNGDWGEEFTAKSAVGEDITVYAKWERFYTVSFDLNGVTGISIDPVFKGDPIPTDIPKKGEMEFIGWFTKNGTETGDWGEELTTTSTITEDITVYAKWNDSTVTFDINGGDIPAKRYYNDKEDIYDYPCVNPTRTGYYFDGWWTKDGTGGDWGEKYTTVDFDNRTEKKTVYARWSQKIVPGADMFDFTFHNEDTTAVSNRVTVTPKTEYENIFLVKKVKYKITDYDDEAKKWVEQFSDELLWSGSTIIADIESLSDDYASAEGLEIGTATSEGGYLYIDEQATDDLLMKYERWNYEGGILNISMPGFTTENVYNLTDQNGNEYTDKIIINKRSDGVYEITWGEADLPANQYAIAYVGSDWNMYTKALFVEKCPVYPVVENTVQKYNPSGNEITIASNGTKCLDNAKLKVDYYPVDEERGTLSSLTPVSQVTKPGKYMYVISVDDSAADNYEILFRYMPKGTDIPDFRAFDNVGFFTVTKKDAEITPQTNAEHTYDGAAYDVSGLFTTDPLAGDKAYSMVKDSETTGEGTLSGNMLTVTKAGTFKIKLNTAETDNCLPGEATAFLTVKKGTPGTVVYPAAGDVTYGDTLEKSTLTGGSTNGSFKWKNESTHPTVNSSGYEVVFTPADGDLYDYSGVNLTDFVSVKVNPLKVIIEWLGTDGLVYDEETKTISARVANAVSGDTPNLTLGGDYSATNVGSYTATVTAVDNPNYTLDGVEASKTWYISGGTNSFTSELTITGWTYGDTANSPGVSAKFGTPHYLYSDRVDGAFTAEVPKNAGTYYVKAAVDGTTDYAELISDNAAEFRIEPKSIADAALSAKNSLKYNGQPQKQEIELSLNGFTNVTYDISDDTETDVNQNGNYKLKVAGNGNFTGSKELEWNIEKADLTENTSVLTTARVRKNRTLADAEITEGEMLGIGNVVIGGSFAWEDPTVVMTADGTAKMKFTPADGNYNEKIIDVSVSTYSSGGGGGSSITRYTVKFDTNGGNTITSQTVTRNSKATEPAKPAKDGYSFDGWYTDSEFTSEYDFDTKVTKNITLYAKWSEDEIQEPTTDEWKNPFADVKENDWFFESVKYANKNGLMIGTTNTTFSPNESLTRGMLVSVFYRAEGEPAVNKSIPFADIDVNAYYANAVVWAQQTGIVYGVTENEFAPDNNITREQIAAIMHRYAKYKGYDISVGESTNILSYTDFDKISEYAIEAMQYAAGSGLMKGKTETTLNPKDFATRAEIAAILQRFIENNK